MKKFINRMIGEAALFGIVLFPVALIFLPALFMGCTDNQRTKVFGGTMTIQVPCDQVVFDVTWKGESFWYATQPAGAGWRPEKKRFVEYSNFGVVEGEAVLVESRCNG
jgi:hypothetical protein